MEDLTTSTTGLSRDHVAKKAYELWLTEGCPSGRSTIHWRLAEEQLQKNPPVKNAGRSEGADRQRPNTTTTENNAPGKGAARQEISNNPAARNRTGQQQPKAAGQEPA